MNRYSNLKVAIVGATGLVGSIFLKVLEEKGFQDCELILAASQKSVGKKLIFCGKEISVQSVESAIAAQPDFAIFSAGGAASLKYAPLFAAAGTIVIDNSSAWRSDPNIPLVVPQINFHAIKKDSRIIANPNCSTIQMVMALAPLHRRYTIKRLVISTYQSITGTGVAAIEQMMGEREGRKVERVYPHKIDLNLFPHGGDFDENGETSEELKLVNETQKILEDKHIQTTATVVRVPVMGGHSEAINIEFENDFDLKEVRSLLENSEGIIVCDDPSQNLYPTPQMAEGKNEVFVGRIRRDLSQKNSLNLWVVADNLRKGAATNAIEILEKMLKNS